MKNKKIILLLIIPIIISNQILIANQQIPQENDKTIILVTGYGPFLKYNINPSELIALELNGETINNAEIIGIPVPVNLNNFTESIEIVYQAVEDYNPDYIFSIGLADGTEEIRIEKIGYNLKIEENSSLKILIPHKRILRISPFPVMKIIRELRIQGIPAKISLFGGLSLCNGLLYSLLDFIDENELEIQSGFIHVPLHKTTEKPDGMKLETMVNATKIIIKTCINN